jgi:hypothetical protein
MNLRFKKQTISNQESHAKRAAGSFRKNFGHCRIFFKTKSIIQLLQSALKASQISLATNNSKGLTLALEILLPSIASFFGCFLANFQILVFRLQMPVLLVLRHDFK